MMSVIHSSDPKDVTIREPRSETNTKMVTWRGSLRGLSVGLLGGMMESRASSRVMPLPYPPSSQRSSPCTRSCWWKPQSCCHHAIQRLARKQRQRGVTDLLDESGHLLLDLLEPGLGVG